MKLVLNISAFLSDSVVNVGFKALHYSEVRADTVADKDAQRTKVRWLITKDDGAEHFAMRCFEMAPGGHSPYHAHEWEHEVFILDGECLVICDDKRTKAGPGYVVFIPPNQVHHFENRSQNVVRFLCLVPHH
jgi:quercetin dioxygenase-like cupin family protein